MPRPDDDDRDDRRPRGSGGRSGAPRRDGARPGTGRAGGSRPGGARTGAGRPGGPRGPGGGSRSGPARGRPERPESAAETARKTGAKRGWGGVARRGAGRMGDDVRGGSGRDERGNPRRLTSNGQPVRRGEWSRDGAPTNRGDDRRPPGSGGGRPRSSDVRPDGRPMRGGEREASPPPSHEPEVWVREDAPPREAPAPRRRERSAPIDADLVRTELSRILPAAKVKRFTDRVGEAGRAFANEQLDDARRILKPIAEQAPGAASVRELLGLTLYQLGRWRPAATELEAFRELTGSVDQNPVLADCYRALGRHTAAEELWEELREASPSAELVTEGRIVAAGSLADRGRLADAIRLLESAPRGKKAREHHLRTAYALADLRERAGDVSRARELFAWISGVDADFADVRRRLSALS